MKHALYLSILAFTLVASAALADKTPAASDRNVGPNGETLPRGKVNLFGRIKTTAQFAKACRPVDGGVLKSGSRQGQPVKLSGQIQAVSTLGMTVNATENRDGSWSEPVTVSFSEMDTDGIDDDALYERGYRPGTIVNVFGIGGTGSVEA